MVVDQEELSRRKKESWAPQKCLTDRVWSGTPKAIRRVSIFNYAEDDSSNSKRLKGIKTRDDKETTAE